jgi:hypothetical protein
MALSISERIALTAEAIAEDDSHGYSQPNRDGNGDVCRVDYGDGTSATVHGGDYDCSELVRVCVNCALTGDYRRPIDWMWTGSEGDELMALGFRRVPFSAGAVRRGDVLWVSGHTGVALGDGMQADAHGDEYGGLTGPNEGDQTGREIEVRGLRSSWTLIYRHDGTESTESEGDMAYRVTVGGDGCNVRKAPSLDAEVSGRLDPGDEITCDRLTQAEGRIWGGYVTYRGNVRWVSLGRANDWITVS